MRFILLDRILALDKGQRIRALKNVALSEDIFEYHFPGFPVLPGAFLLESFEEASILLIEATQDYSVLPTLRCLRNAKYRRFVRPGAQLLVEAEFAAPLETRCRASVEGREVASADLEFSLVPCSRGAGYLTHLLDLTRLLSSMQ
jgi:3-hydroxyacyl-[acyl-carrier-protein] dehydratase